MVGNTSRRVRFLEEVIILYSLSSFDISLWCFINGVTPLGVLITGGLQVFSYRRRLVNDIFAGLVG
jgi:hypothetical protein